MTESYIVSFKEDTQQSVVDKLIKDIESAGGKITHRYTIIRGFAGQIPPKMLDILRAHEKIASIEADQVVHVC